jgi:hypothetical protein
LQAPLLAPDSLVRPWRTATLVASLVAAVELVIVIALSVLLLARPLAHTVQHHAAATQSAAATKPIRTPAAVQKHVPAVKAKLSRTHTGVLVLNGNGRHGAAGAEASRLQHFGYRIRATGNATRSDYATTVVMYRSGYRAEGLRLAHDMHLRVVGPLDGLHPAALHGAQLAVIVGVG